MFSLVGTEKHCLNLMLELVFCQFEPDNTWNQRFLSWLNMCHGLLDFLWPDEELSNMNWSIFDSGPSVNLTWAISVVSAHKPLNFTSLSHASVLQLCWMWHGLKQANPSFISPHFSLSLFSFDQTTDVPVFVQCRLQNVLGFFFFFES